MPKQISPVYHFSLRYSIPKDRDLVFAKGEVPSFRSCLVEELSADKYIFQLEDTINNLHFQCYFHVKDKTRVGHLCGILKDSPFRGAHISPASTAGKSTLAKYCMKSESRVFGPFADKVIYLGADLMNFEDFSPPQRTLYDYLKYTDPITNSKRKSIWIYDPIGGSGKSAFKKYCQYHCGYMGFTYANARDILYLVSKFPNKRCYFFNLTKTKSSEVSELELYSAIENIKDGDFISFKYEVTAVMMNPAHVVVFANHLPNIALMTKGRFDIYKWAPLPDELTLDKEVDLSCVGCVKLNVEEILKTQELEAEQVESKKRKYYEVFRKC